MTSPLLPLLVNRAASKFGSSRDGDATSRVLLQYLSLDLTFTSVKTCVLSLIFVRQ